VINTGTTIVTFLMVFLIQNTQNRDAEAIAGEARRAAADQRGRTQRAARSRGARGVESSTGSGRATSEIAERAREELRAAGSDTGSPEVE
jgi:hypothetical protein